MFSIKPKDEKFFELFLKGIQVSNSAAKELRALMDELGSPDKRLGNLTRLEHEGDTIAHELMEYTNKMFITPLDREDIFSITREIDNVTDDIDSTGHRFYMYYIDKPTTESLDLLDKLVTATEELVGIISELKSLNKSATLIKKIIHVNTIENEADQIYRKAIRKLFENPTDVLFVTKWNHIYKYIEDSIDSCEKLANEIWGVVMKYA
ncbi:MAG: DUF47 family protein [Bacillota bacterium]|nr:DUF47 family protein [Bacillota bacterium]